MTKTCQFCFAKLWTTKTSIILISSLIYCANEQVILPPLQTLPDDVCQLFVATIPHSLSHHLELTNMYYQLEFTALELKASCTIEFAISIQMVLMKDLSLHKCTFMTQSMKYRTDCTGILNSNVLSFPPFPDF